MLKFSRDIETLLLQEDEIVALNIQTAGDGNANVTIYTRSLVRVRARMSIEQARTLEQLVAATPIEFKAHNIYPDDKLQAYVTHV